MAAGYRGALVMTSGARVRLDGDGMVTVETDMTDIGTGSYTIIAQTAAEMMGVPLEKVAVRLGDSHFPVSAGSGGQFGANSATAGVYAACVKLRPVPSAPPTSCSTRSASAGMSDALARNGGRSIRAALKRR